MYRRENRSVRLTKIKDDPERFQHRLVKLDNAHASTLEEVLARGEELARIDVWHSPEDELVILDGHHRREAYERAGWARKVPVRIHHCSEAEAQLVTVADNGKARLGLSREEKSNWAWRMVCEHPDVTVKEVARCSVSERTVKSMRKVKKLLLEAEEEFPSSWAEARWRALNGDVDGEWTDAMREQRREERKAKLRERIRADLALAAERDTEAAIEVVQEIMGKQRFEDGAAWLGFVKADEVEPDF